MRKNIVLIISILVILVVSWLDYQFFMEEQTSLKVSDTIRKAGHLISLLIIALTGFFTWKRISRMISLLWVSAYGLLFILLLTIGLLDRLFHFGNDFLNEISRLRGFFCSPMPVTIFYLFYRLTRKEKATG